MVRLNFSVRNGKRWDPHAITTLVRFQCACHLCGAAPVIRLKEISGNAGLNSLIEQASRIRAPSALRKASGRLRPHFGASPLPPFSRGAIKTTPESFRVISTARLRPSPTLHLQPINVVVSNDPQRDLILWLASCLDAFSTYPYQTRLPGGAPGGTTGRPEVCPTRSSRTSVGATQISTPTTDRDRTVSRRSEPSSRATLMGEQPNPWDLLQPQDVTSRHRGAKPLRRFELLGGISLLSPEYLLSFERWPFHAEPPDHYALVSYLDDLCVSQSSALVPLHSAAGYQSA